MNSSQDAPQFDELDRRLQRALLECPVDPLAKQRVRGRLVSRSSMVDSQSTAMSDQDLPGGAVEPDAAGRFPAPNPAASTAASRRRFVWLGVGLATTACLILSVSFLVVRGKTSQSQLVASCTDLMNDLLNRPVQWNRPQDLAELGFLQAAGLYQQPTSIVRSELEDSPFGQRGFVWKLSFNNRRDLYVLEFFHARQVDGLHALVRTIPGATSDWSMAASQGTDRHLIVYMSRESLQQYLQLVPLA